MFLNLFTTMIISLSAFSALAGEAPLKCKTDKVEFKISTIETMRGKTLGGADSQDQATLEAPYTRIIYRGKLVVVKICENVQSLKIKEISIPAAGKLTLRGVNLRAANHGFLAVNETLSIMNAKGKKLQEAINHKFVGGKIAVTAAIGVALNPNFSLMANKAGLVITDIERLINIGPALGLGVVLSHTDLKIYADFTRVSEEDKALLDKTL